MIVIEIFDTFYKFAETNVSCKVVCKALLTKRCEQISGTAFLILILTQFYAWQTSNSGLHMRQKMYCEL